MINVSNKEIADRFKQLTLEDFQQKGWYKTEDGSFSNKDSTTIKMLDFPNGIDSFGTVIYELVVVVNKQGVGSYLFSEGIEGYSKVRYVLLDEIKDLIMTIGEAVLEEV